jgi:hypothetical protein
MWMRMGTMTSQTTRQSLRSCGRHGVVRTGGHQRLGFNLKGERRCVLQRQYISTRLHDAINQENTTGILCFTCSSPISKYCENVRISQLGTRMVNLLKWLVTIRTTWLNIRNCNSPPHNVFMCSVWFWEWRAAFSVTETQCFLWGQSYVCTLMHFVLRTVYVRPTLDSWDLPWSGSRKPKRTKRWY